MRERIEALEAKSSHNEALVATIAANFVPKGLLDEMVKMNIDKVWVELEKLTEYDKTRCQAITQLAQRLNKVEQFAFSDGDVTAIHGQINNIHKNDKHNDHRLTTLEESYQGLFHEITHIEERIDGCEQNYPSLWKRIKSIEEHLKEYHEIVLGACPIEIEKLNRKIPHKCPVCDGTGYSGKPYFRNALDDMVLDGIKVYKGQGIWMRDGCHACDSTGIVWQPEKPHEPHKNQMSRPFVYEKEMNK